MKDIATMPLTDVCIEMKRIERTAGDLNGYRSSQHKQYKALKARKAELLLEQESRGARIINPDEYDEGQG